MRPRNLVHLGLLVLACAGAEDGDLAEGDEATECDRSNRSGVYLIQYEEHSDGTCGAIPEVVATLDDPAGMMNSAGACEVVSERWSKHDCRLERHAECVVNGYPTTITGFTDSNESGSKITGKVTFTVAGYCTSTYDVTGTRQ